VLPFWRSHASTSASPRCSARVEHVADLLLIEADQGDHDFAVGGEPADDAHGDFVIKRMCDSPEFVPARLPDSLEGRGLLGWLRREAGEGLQQRATATVNSWPPCFSA
jgi:hypothetical protein